MAGNDVYLYSVPSDANSNDVRLRDPTVVVGRIDYSAVLTAGAFTFTGVSITPKVARFAALTAGAFTYTGQSIGPVAGRVAPLTAGVFSLTGSDLTATVVAKVAYSVTLTAGAFIYTGDLLTVSSTAVFVEENRGHGGWDPHHYTRNRRKEKSLKEFYEDILGQIIEEPSEKAEAAIEGFALAAQKYEAAIERDAPITLTNTLFDQYQRQFNRVVKFIAPGRRAEFASIVDTEEEELEFLLMVLDME